ncbi:uncharacterized protein LOC121873490 isoform X1 [Homarus americanus]|uniref:uncharacterized protein LOC121873490 isoform X1 n=1 Tax=Homarus americanus TaxID=6706 RepID=UPI001C473477|nr:uncharacterized protein LOC121873490 isoform X1 [Homarus americanus]
MCVCVVQYVSCCSSIQVSVHSRWRDSLRMTGRGKQKTGVVVEGSFVGVISVHTSMKTLNHSTKFGIAMAAYSAIQQQCGKPVSNGGHQTDSADYSRHLGAASTKHYGKLCTISLEDAHLTITMMELEVLKMPLNTISVSMAVPDDPYRLVFVGKTKACSFKLDDLRVAFVVKLLSPSEMDQVISFIRNLKSPDSHEPQFCGPSSTEAQILESPSPGPQFPGPQSPGPQSPGPQSPGPQSPGPPSPSFMCSANITPSDSLRQVLPSSPPTNSYNTEGSRLHVRRLSGTVVGHVPSQHLSGATYHEYDTPPPPRVFEAPYDVPLPGPPRKVREYRPQFRRASLPSQETVSSEPFQNLVKREPALPLSSTRSKRNIQQTLPENQQEKNIEYVDHHYFSFDEDFDSNLEDSHENKESLESVGQRSKSPQVHWDSADKKDVHGDSGYLDMSVVGLPNLESRYAGLNEIAERVYEVPSSQTYVTMSHRNDIIDQMIRDEEQYVLDLDDLQRALAVQGMNNELLVTAQRLYEFHRMEFKPKLQKSQTSQQVAAAFTESCDGFSLYKDLLVKSSKSLHKASIANIMDKVLSTMKQLKNYKSSLTCLQEREPSERESLQVALDIIHNCLTSANTQLILDAMEGCPFRPEQCGSALQTGYIQLTKGLLSRDRDFFTMLTESYLIFIKKTPGNELRYGASMRMETVSLRQYDKTDSLTVEGVLHMEHRESPRQAYRMTAGSPQEANKWVEAINGVLERQAKAMRAVRSND